MSVTYRWSFLDWQATSDWHVGRVSIHSERPTDTSVDISSEAPNKIHDPLVLSAFGKFWLSFFTWFFIIWFAIFGTFLLLGMQIALECLPPEFTLRTSFFGEGTTAEHPPLGLFSPPSLSLLMTNPPLLCSPLYYLMYLDVMSSTFSISFHSPYSSWFDVEALLSSLPPFETVVYWFVSRNSAFAFRTQ